MAPCLGCSLFSFSPRSPQQAEGSVRSPLPRDGSACLGRDLGEGGGSQHPTLGVGGGRSTRTTWGFGRFGLSPPLLAAPKELLNAPCTGTGIGVLPALPGGRDGGGKTCSLARSSALLCLPLGSRAAPAPHPRTRRGEAGSCWPKTCPSGREVCGRCCTDRSWSSPVEYPMVLGSFCQPVRLFFFLSNKGINF